MIAGGKKRSAHAYRGKHRSRGGRTAAKIGARAKGIIKAFEEIEYEQRKMDMDATRGALHLRK